MERNIHAYVRKKMEGWQTGGIDERKGSILIKRLYRCGEIERSGKNLTIQCIQPYKAKEEADRQKMDENKKTNLDTLQIKFMEQSYGSAVVLIVKRTKIIAVLL